MTNQTFNNIFVCLSCANYVSDQEAKTNSHDCHPLKVKVCDQCNCNLEVEGIKGQKYDGQTICSAACKLDATREMIEEMQRRIINLKHIALDLECEIIKSGNHVYQ